MLFFKKLASAPRAVVIAGLVLIATSMPVQAQTLKFASNADLLSLDPHSVYEPLQLNFLLNIYEGLVRRSSKLEFIPGLATSWKRTAPTVWRFELRKGVKFHDGSLMTADDVVFSVDRARGEGSDLRSLTGSIKEVRKISDEAIEIETAVPNLVLPNNLVFISILSKKWAIENKAERPADRRKAVENYATFKANGTGAYRVRERQPGLRTALDRNAFWWDKAQGNVATVLFTPLNNEATRVAALLSGEVDVIESVPLQDIDRISSNSGLKIEKATYYLTLYLSLDKGREELLYSNVKGKNPFRDLRVRQALYHAIDIESIKTTVMRGASEPTSSYSHSAVRGYVPELEKRLPFDIEKAKGLLAEAGYPNGFEITFHCSSDLYVADSKTCQAIAASLAKVGIKTNLQIEPRAIHSPRVRRGEFSLAIGAVANSTLDGFFVLNTWFGTPDGKTRGVLNLHGFSNAKFDNLLGQIEIELDSKRRDAMMREAQEIIGAELPIIPLHRTPIIWGMKKSVTAAPIANNSMIFDWITVGK